MPLRPKRCGLCCINFIQLRPFSNGHEPGYVEESVCSLIGCLSNLIKRTFNQIDLAEVFVSKAISLLPHASQTLMTWTERMQVNKSMNSN